MYITGNISDFASRLHELPQITGDLLSFKTEVSGYWGTYDSNYKNKLQTEAGNQWHRLASGSILYQTGYYF